jgi:hypothetical protein
MNSNIYWERQRGDLCRLHSINAYFGFKKIDETEFFKYCSEYDEIIKGLKTVGMDGFSEGRCIISYILDKIDKQYVFLIPINSYNGVRNEIDIERYTKLIKLVKGFFEFNKGHVWFNKKINGNWYKIDSISGVNMINEPSIRNNGILLIIDSKHLYNEIFYYLNLVNSDNSDNSDIEVIFINLYYALKNIELNKKSQTNEKYNKNIEVLILIKDLLSSYIENNRLNKNTDKIVEKIKMLVNQFIINTN